MMIKYKDTIETEKFSSVYKTASEEQMTSREVLNEEERFILNKALEHAAQCCNNNLHLELSFEEKLLLSLYLELFNRCYNPTDVRRYDDSGVLIRHIEMQNTCYLFQTLGVTPSNFGFMWEQKGPYSSGVQVLLRKLDFKGAHINHFYDHYNKKRNIWYQSYQQQLRELLFPYLSDEQIEKVAMTCYLLENTIQQEMGSEILAGMLFLIKTAYPGSDYSTIMKKLEERGYSSNSELTQEIWKTLSILGIIGMETKKFDVKKRVLREKK